LKTRKEQPSIIPTQPQPVSKGGLTLSTRPKQVKNPWNADEQTLFIEALQMHGPKKMKEISDHIKTRSVT